MGPNNIVMAWKNTTPEVLFRSRMRSFNDFNGQLYSVGTDGDLPKQLPVPRGGFMSYSPDDTKMAYNRVFREFRTWKDYRGGMADESGSTTSRRARSRTSRTTPPRTSSRCGRPTTGSTSSPTDSRTAQRLNLYSYDLATKATVQHTHFKDFDIKFPSLGGGVIVFEEAGYIWAFDIKAGAAKRLPIVVRDDFVTARPVRMNVSKFVEDMNPSPDGKRVVVNARGDTFTVPAKDGSDARPQPQGRRPRARRRVVSGRQVDRLRSPTCPGENELYVRPQDGTGDPVQLTKGADTYYYNPLWSPDSKKLLWADRLQRLRFVTVETKEVTLVDTATAFEIRQYAWSPDSKWITWARPEDESLPKVWLFSRRRRKEDRRSRTAGTRPETRLQRRRQVPPPRVGPGLQADGQRHRARPRLPEPRARVPGRALEGHRLPVQAEERRGRDRGPEPDRRSRMTRLRIPRMPRRTRRRRRSSSRSTRTASRTA